MNEDDWVVLDPSNPVSKGYVAEDDKRRMNVKIPQ
jgi:hypothetical protein